MFAQHTRHYMRLKGHCRCQAELQPGGKEAEWELHQEEESGKLACRKTRWDFYGKGAGARGEDTEERNGERERQ
ncbi:hypothetical protein WISP_143771 [Willisornis vidua]|uniref:MHC class I antigen n=1 Tax=Willisornis vidua TaxID=1566151 RepID=A0ABQ9CR45_9PASS|nr:hypothetical protein WISP_143771 [Willisornis vidua]